MDIEELFNKLFSTDSIKKEKNEYINIFKLPIELIDNKKLLDENILNDLELINYKNLEDISDSNINNLDICNININKELQDFSNNNLYTTLFSNSNEYDDNLIKTHAKYYTNDKNYLIDTQNLFKTFKINHDRNDINLIDNSNNNIYKIFDNIIFDNNFIINYQYIDIPYINKYNSDQNILQVLSIYNLSSPIISLILPIISIFLPFFIIKLQNLEITLEEYVNYLKSILGNHIFGQLLEFNNQALSSKIYLIISLLLYFFQLYQNFNYCIKFFKNIKIINEKLLTIKEYLYNSINKFNNLLNYTKHLKSYEKFNIELNNNIEKLNKFYKKMNKIDIYKLNMKKFFNIGYMMSCFYDIYNDEELIKTIHYTHSCNSYINKIDDLQKKISSKEINFCYFDNSKNTYFNNSYYGKLIDDNIKIVKNTYDLSHNMILTGPNAAGKTTLLKSTIFNIILSQQFGIGFYSDSNINIYDYIHCYINIPDTSNRDSLFQAEARRCKNIINIIENNPTKKHFCVFDELYSGTNPNDAIKSAYSYLKYLNNNNNVKYILTTHYNKLCKKLNNDTNSKNYHMQIISKDNKLVYKYKLKDGINKVKGCLDILQTLNYPKEILNNY